MHGSRYGLQIQNKMMYFSCLVFQLTILIFNQIVATKLGNCKNGKSYVETNYEDWRWNPFFCEYPSSSSFCQNAWWLGATDSAKEGTWTWTHDNSKFSFARWGANQPDGKSYVETNYEDWRWNPFFCEYPSSSSFCQNTNGDSTGDSNGDLTGHLTGDLTENLNEMLTGDLTKILTADITKLSEAIVKITKQIKEEKQTQPKCPPEFVAVGSFCYFFSKEVLNWFGAYGNCKSKGAELAHPSTKEKNTQLIDYIKKNFPTKEGWWLGASDLAEEGTFRWTHDNSKLNFTYWSQGEPDSYDKIQDCLCYWTTGASGWYDLSCDYMQYQTFHICEHNSKLV
ncbi:Fc fragment of IgE, low affinity II, receptor for (CD23) [Chamberlinius hualienensis]